MDDQKETGSKAAAPKKENVNLRRFRPKFSRLERVYLSLSDILSVAMIVLDLSYLGGVTEVDPVLLLLSNLFMVGFSFVGYQMKKRVRRRTLRELQRLREKEEKQDERRPEGR